MPPAAAGEEKEKEARTPRAPAGGLRPPAPPASRAWAWPTLIVPAPPAEELLVLNVLYN